MKVLVLVVLIVMPLEGMDKILEKINRSPRKDEKKEKEEKSKLSHEEKQKRIADRRGSEVPVSRETQSASPLKGSSASPVRQKANTLGKRGSLDWSMAIQDTARQIHMEESYKKWSEKDAAEESLKKLFEEFSSADAKRQQEIYCIVMRTSVVSATKEAMASNFFDISHKIASLALYNIPGYFSTNVEGARTEIKTFYKAIFDAKEAYINKLSAEASKRDKWTCEQVALKDPKSPIFKLLAQIEGLKLKYPQYAKDLEPEIFQLPESRIQDPKKP